jgi:hypothetical protein
VSAGEGDGGEVHRGNYKFTLSNEL